MGRKYEIGIVARATTDQAARSLRRLSGAASTVDRGLSRTSAAAGRAMLGITRSATLALGVAVAGSARLAYDEMVAAAESTANLKAGLESTGGAAGLTMKQLKGMAQQLHQLTGVDDQVIEQAQAMLLTFTKIKAEGGIFDRALVSAMDLSAKGYGPLETTIKQVGKALNDPIKGLAALGRVGVQFTQSQRDQIEAMVDAGNVMGAQKLILAELERQAGGTAAALGQTWAMRISRLKESFAAFGAGVLQRTIPPVEKFVAALQKGGSLRPIVNALVYAGRNLAGAFREGGAAFANAFGGDQKSAVRDVSSAIRKLSDEVRRWAPLVGKVTGEASRFVVDHGKTIAGLVIAWRLVRIAALRAAVTQAITAMLNPIGLVTVGVLAIAAGFIYLWNASAKLREGFAHLQASLNDFGATCEEMAATAIDAFMNAADTVVESVARIADAIGQAPGAAGEKYRRMAEDIRGLGDGFTDMGRRAADAMRRSAAETRAVADAQRAMTAESLKLTPEKLFPDMAGWWNRQIGALDELDGSLARTTVRVKSFKTAVTGMSVKPKPVRVTADTQPAQRQMLSLNRNINAIVRAKHNVKVTANTISATGSVRSFKTFLSGVTTKKHQVKVQATGMTQAQSAANALAKSLGKVALSAGTAAANAVKQFTSGIDKLAPAAARAATAAVRAMESGLKPLDAAMGAAARVGVARAIADANNATGGAHAVGQRIGQGIESGIRSQVSSIAFAAAQAVTAAIQAAQAAAEVASPSRRAAREVGVPIAQGIAQGIVTGMHLAKRNAGQAVETLIAGMKPSMLMAPGVGPALARQAELQNELQKLLDLEKKSKAQLNRIRALKTELATVNAKIGQMQRGINNVAAISSMVNSLHEWRVAIAGKETQKHINERLAGLNRIYAAGLKHLKTHAKSMSDEMRAQLVGQLAGIKQQIREIHQAAKERKEAAKEAAREAKRQAEEAARQALDDHRSAILSQAGRATAWERLQIALNGGVETEQMLREKLAALDAAKQALWSSFGADQSKWTEDQIEQIASLVEQIDQVRDAINDPSKRAGYVEPSTSDTVDSVDGTYGAVLRILGFGPGGDQFGMVSTKLSNLSREEQLALGGSGVAGTTVIVNQNFNSEPDAFVASRSMALAVKTAGLN